MVWVQTTKSSTLLSMQKTLEYLKKILTGPCHPLNCNCDDRRSAKHRAEVAAVIAIWSLVFFFGGLILYMAFLWQPQ